MPPGDTSAWVSSALCGLFTVICSAFFTTATPTPALCIHERGDIVVKRHHHFHPVTALTRASCLECEIVEAPSWRL